MIISFDLDDTLIPGMKQFETEKQNWLQRLWGLEKIRLGTKSLFRDLKSEGHQIYIYTTSYRPVSKIGWTFRWYGIPVDTIINRQKHNKHLIEAQRNSSKYPLAFGIDLHLDDSLGVKMEGEKYNFRTLIIEEDDRNWTWKVLEEVEKIIGRSR